jgi:hypothetical protein
MADNFIQMNPLYGVYSEFQKILDTLVIKYSYLAEESETFEIKKAADTYITSKNNLDTFFTYRDYTFDELYAVGITNVSLIEIYRNGDGYLQIPENYRESLLLNRRKSILKNYEEKNEYYRKLNGFPPLNTPINKYHYIIQEYADKYSIDVTIPIHKIQDHYNSIEPGNGDYLISIIEGLGYLNTLREKYPEDEYLNYIGSRRIDIETARKAKNFQILYSSQSIAPSLIYDEFMIAYERARDYFVSSIFIREYRNIVPYYDQFIAMCIMFMTIEITINKQFKLGIDRKYYNDYTLKMLYDAYGIPYDLDIDDYTQRSIAQSLNTLIQKKSTDDVFYNIANILGFDNLKIYSFYLIKERKFDAYGIPVISYTEKFNSDTGEFERIPNYSEMYDVYFQKIELPATDFINSFNNTANMEKYEKITEADPFWWEDENISKAVWETEYNFVESKYLSVGLSYKMTEIMYENVLLLKLLMSVKEPLSTITFTLPRIDENLTVTLFDAVILLFCLTSKKHNLLGEIISIPSQVESVLDYLHNTDGGDEYLVNSFGFDFDLLQADNPAGQKMISQVYSVLDEDDADRFLSYMKTLYIDKNIDNSNKIELFNNIFTNVKGLSNYLQYLMTKTTDRKTYEILNEFYHTVYYSKEVKSIFTINNDKDVLKRTAKNYFEFLYYHNPQLYLSLFNPNYEEQYAEFIKENKLNSNDYTLDDFKYDVEYGNIEDFSYSSLIGETSESDVTNDLLYYYIDHVISRIESFVDNMKFIYLINDTTNSVADLLVKMIKFFKSFTVDMLGLDIVYIMDFKAENTMRFFDEIKSIKSNIYIGEDFKFSYKDTVSVSAQVTLEDHPDNGHFFTDKITRKYYSDESE